MHIDKYVKVGWVELYDPFNNTTFVAFPKMLLVEQESSGQNMRIDHKSGKNILQFHIPVTNSEASFSWNH